MRWCQWEAMKWCQREAEHDARRGSNMIKSRHIVDWQRWRTQDLRLTIMSLSDYLVDNTWLVGDYTSRLKHSIHLFVWQLIPMLHRGEEGGNNDNNDVVVFSPISWEFPWRFCLWNDSRSLYGFNPRRVSSCNDLINLRGFNPWRVWAFVCSHMILVHTSA